MPQFSKTEKQIIDIFNKNKEFTYNKTNYKLKVIDKPKCKGGEPKTDIYILLDENGKDKEIKISVKQTNADFLENKMSEERAEQVFGSEWKKIISNSLLLIKDKFEAKKLIYKDHSGKTAKGCFTLGWKYEMLNKKSGELSEDISKVLPKELSSYEVLKECLMGNKLDCSKKNSIVSGKMVINSGVATSMLTVDNKKPFKSVTEILDNLQTIDEYIEKNNGIYFACKALNFRTMKWDKKVFVEFINKWDGDRPLSLFVDWKVNNGKLDYELVYNKPLITKGNSVACKLKVSLQELNIKSSDDINITNVESQSIIQT